MTILVTGSSGHLGEALMRTLRGEGRAAIGLDVLPSPFTDVVGSVADRAAVERAMSGVRTVLHTATLHKPHVGTHGLDAFVETNVRGTLILLEEAARAGVQSFVMTSTTSAFGDALKPPPGEPAAWIDETVAPVPKNIYGVTKTAAEDLCRLFRRNEKLPCVVLRTSRFFPEADDDPEARTAFEDANLKANEYLLPPRRDRGRGRRASPRRGARAGARLRPLRDQRDDAVPPRGRRTAARRRGGGRARAGAGVGGRVRPARLAHGRLDRPRLRQRARQDGARLAAEVGFWGGDRPVRETGDIRGPWRS